MGRPSEEPPQGAFLRPPSRITASLKRQTSSSSSSKFAVNLVKKPIPPHKLPHASKLYSELRMKEGLAQLSPDPNASSSLGSVGSVSTLSQPPPLTSGSRSTTGHTVPSFDAVSEYSSVVSFGPPSQTSARSKQRNEAFSYQGKPVKQRVRKKLPPVAKAKTALIRYLEACQNCRSRNVPCPLEHHDIESLESAYQSKSAKQESDSQYIEPTPIREMQIENTYSYSGQATPVTSGHNNALLGIGAFAPAESFDPQLAFSPFASDMLEEAGLSQDGYGFSILNDYSSLDDGCLFPLGFFDGSTYKCHHVDKCRALFANPEDLQEHFEHNHFEFIRIDPYFRWICTKCFFSHPDYACTCGGSVKRFVCGQFIGNVQYPPEPPSRQRNDYTRDNSPKVHSDLSNAYLDLGEGLAFNAHATQNFGNNANANFDVNGSAMYPDLNSGGFGTYTYDSAQPGGSRYTGNARTLNRGTNKAATAPMQYHMVKVRQPSKYQMALMSILLLFITITISLHLYQWMPSTIVSKTYDFIPGLPTIGFIGFLTSFAASWVARAIHYIPKSKSSKTCRSSLHAFTPWQMNMDKIHQLS